MTATKTRKISVNLSESASEVVRTMADQRGTTVSDVVREALSLYQFIQAELANGKQVQLTQEDSDIVEKVHLVFAT